MKCAFSTILALVILFSQIHITNTYAEQWNYFIITAYYSPLPDQEYYNTGNYEDEVILNGQGIAGASGKKVFSGMLAAPWKYTFGTKIYLEWLGVWEVSDRWGAIVEAGKRWYEHDRIDIWMWYGEEWMRRANYWGKRKVAGSVIWSGNKVTLNIDSLSSPSWAVVQKNTGKRKAKQTSSPQYSVFDISLGKWSNADYVSQLQSILKETGYLRSGYQSGSYDTATIDAVYEFQVENKVISYEYDAWAGSYGPKTRKKLKEYYDNYLEKLALEAEYQEKIATLQSDSYTLAEKQVENLWEIQYGDISSEVREFQKILATLGYFEYKDTAIYGVKTQNALIAFQIDKWIISWVNASDAGVFWEQTQQELIYALNHVYLNSLLDEHGLENISSTSTDEEEIQEIALEISRI